MLEDMFNFPEELRVIDSWFIAASSGAPCKVINGKLIPVDPVFNPGYSFVQAYNLALETDSLIGFYLSKDDPYTCIDLDVKDPQSHPDKPAVWTTPEQFNNYRKLLDIFKSYTEVSRHGKGVHIWFKANIGAGLKREGIEIYSRERFIICTGRSMHTPARLIADHTMEALTLAESMREGLGDNYELKEIEPIEDDYVVYERAANAENHAKFRALAIDGDWMGQNYPSQSEADLALMSMFAFYTPSNEQCRRLFRTTALGARDKANKNNYHLDRQLKICRARIELEERERKLALDHGSKLASSLINKLNSSYSETGFKGDTVVDPEQFKPVGTSAPVEQSIPWPPGFAGALAQFLYSNEVRPVPEIAIVVALAALAGICGGAYNLPSTGLNMYIVLVAKSAIGKEGMHSGLSIISQTMRANGCSHAENLFDFMGHSSGSSLLKSLSMDGRIGSCININGEWGKIVERLSNETNNGPLQSLKTMMTNLYQKSDIRSTVGGISYSDKEKNVKAMGGFAYSMIGESTPETYYGALDRTMMEDGFLSRFLTVEYTGPRPAINEDTVKTIPDNMVQYLIAIHNQVATCSMSKTIIPVVQDSVAKKMLRDFNLECDNAINKSEDEALRQIWNRAHLKALRLAALLAVGDNYLEPVIYKQHAEWALLLVRKDMECMLKRIQEGAVGKSDETRVNRIISLTISYFEGSFKARNDIARNKGIVTRADLQQKAYSYAAFRTHRAGAGAAFEQAMRAILDMGYLQECDPKTMSELKLKGKAYFVTDSLFVQGQENV